MVVVTVRLPGGGVGGLRASTLASQVLGKLKNQVHCGSTVPATPCTTNSASYSASFLTNKSDPTPMSVQPVGPVKPTSPFVIVTPNASAPALTGIAPGSAIVVDEPEPDAERCSPSACAVTVPTPVHAEIATPPSTTGRARFARTARILPPDGSYNASGKFCTFVAT